MTSSAALLTFIALSAAIIAVPGPSVMFVIGRALALGQRAALLTVVGNAAGAYAQVVLVAVGLGAVLDRSVLAFTIVKYVGAAYLVWLGVQAIRGRSAGTTSTGAVDRGAVSTSKVLREGFVVGVTNPKLAVFLSAFLPQFVDPSGWAVPLQMALLGIVFVAVALVLDSLWAIGAATARSWITGSSTGLSRLRLAGGVTMVGLGVQLAVSGRSD